MKKLLGIIILSLLLSGCATPLKNETSIKDILVLGSDKKTLCKSKYTLTKEFGYNSRAMCHGLFEKHYQYISKYQTEIIWNGEVKVFFVYENVTIPMTCTNMWCKHGDGRLKRIAFSQEEAFAYADPTLTASFSKKYKKEMIEKKKEAKLLETKQKEQKQRAEAKASGDLTFTIKDKKEQCTAIGFELATEKFADCVLRLVELDVKSQQATQIALAQSQGNQQVAEQLKKQNNSRSSDAFINFGLKLLSPQSTVSAPTTSTCRVIGSGAYKTVNCW